MTPSLRACAVLLDIDGTIVDPSGSDHALHDALYRCVATNHGVDCDEAVRRVHALFDPSLHDPEAYLPQLDVDPVAYRRLAVDMMRQNTTVYPDAVELIRWLIAQRVRLYPATTNGPTAITIKLTVAGLADISGKTCFDELFGGSTVCPDGKTGPAFFTAILQRIDANSDEVVMVGDDPVNDIEHAIGAGIHQAVLVDRQQSEPWRSRHLSAIRVNALTEAIPFLSMGVSCD